jgi:hypothetical protein
MPPLVHYSNVPPTKCGNYHYSKHSTTKIALIAQGIYFLHFLHLSVRSTLFLKRTKTVFISYISLQMSYLSTLAFEKCTGSLNDEPHKGGFNLESLNKNSYNLPVLNSDI